MAERELVLVAATPATVVRRQGMCARRLEGDLLCVPCYDLNFLTLRPNAGPVEEEAGEEADDDEEAETRHEIIAASSSLLASAC